MKHRGYFLAGVATGFSTAMFLMYKSYCNAREREYEIRLAEERVPGGHDVAVELRNNKRHNDDFGKEYRPSL